MALKTIDLPKKIVFIQSTRNTIPFINPSMRLRPRGVNDFLILQKIYLFTCKRNVIHDEKNTIKLAFINNRYIFKTGSFPS